MPAVGRFFLVKALPDLSILQKQGMSSPWVHMQAQERQPPPVLQLGSTQEEAWVKEGVSLCSRILEVGGAVLGRFG